MISLRWLITRRAADPDEADPQVPDDAEGRQMVTHAVREGCDVWNTRYKNPPARVRRRRGL